MKKVLITGFEPFGGDDVNPALEAVTKLEGHALDGAVIVTCSVPVVYQKSINTVIEAIKVHQPDYVITVGQAAGRAAITPERVAINVDDYRIKDNEGNQIVDELINENGPSAYFSTLPIKAIVKSLQENGIPAQISNTAGTYVCNHLFYGVQDFLKESHIGHGFIHIPLLPSQAPEGNQPTLSLDIIVEGLIIAAQAIVDNECDIKFSAGSIC